MIGCVKPYYDVPNFCASKTKQKQNKRKWSMHLGQWILKESKLFKKLKIKISILGIKYPAVFKIILLKTR